MRMLLAFIYMGVGMWIYLRLGGENLHPFVGVGVWLALMFSSVYVCNEGLLRRLKGQSVNDYIEELLVKKQAVREYYKAQRAITFDDLSTGCLCHIVDIGNDRLLCLHGQYLYDYVQIDDDPELNQDRKFPTSEFSLVRIPKRDQVVRLDIGKDVVDEIRLENANLRDFYDLGIKLGDGEIISGISFSKLLDSCKRR